MSTPDDEKKTIKDENKARKDKIVADYHERLKVNEEMVREVQEILDGFRTDHQDLTAALRDNLDKMRIKLANEREERLRSYTQMMKEIHTVLSRIKKEVEGIRTSAENFCKDYSTRQNKMASALHIELKGEQAARAEWNGDRVKEFESLMKNMNQLLKTSFEDMRNARYSDTKRVQKDVSAIITGAENLLEQFSKARTSMSAEQNNELKMNMTERVNSTAALMREFDQQFDEIATENKKTADMLMHELGMSRKDLAHNNKQRLSEFQTSMDGIKKSVQEMREYVHTLLNGFSVERVQPQAKKAEPAPQAKKAEPAPQAKKAEPAPQAKKAEPAPQVKKAEPAPQAKKAEPVVPPSSKTIKPPASKNAKTDSTKDITLEEKVLNHINASKEGVTIVDMEKLLGESRMKLSYITEQLLNDGKIQKVQNVYYPKSE